ncbi:MAG: response regulator [Candidatus Omnitrophota bacterium]
MNHLKILAVDDDQDFLEELKDTLCLSGYDVDIESENEKILNKMDEYKPDILLLDLKMTPKSGFQIADELRNYPQWNDVKIIGMTGIFNEREHQTFTHLCGINSLITKPVTPLQLIAHIEQILN